MSDQTFATSLAEAEALYDMATRQWMSILSRNTQIIRKRPLTDLELEESIRYQDVAVMCKAELEKFRHAKPSSS